MPNFDYEAPTTLAEALKIMARPGEVRPLAGGTDIIDQLKSNRRNADLVVDMKRIPELLELSMNGSGLRIGSAVSCTDVLRFTAKHGGYPALSESAALIGSVHIHLVAAIPNGLILEYYRDSVNPMYGKVWEHELTIKDGYVYAPDLPGLGLIPKWDTLEPYRVG